LAINPNPCIAAQITEGRRDSGNLNLKIINRSGGVYRTCLGITFLDRRTEQPDTDENWARWQTGDIAPIVIKHRASGVQLCL